MWSPGGDELRTGLVFANVRNDMLESVTDEQVSRAGNVVYDLLEPVGGT